MTPAEKLRAAFELHEAGLEIMRQNLYRHHPDASATEIERLLVEWIRTRPGAEHGDAEGTPKRPPASMSPLVQALEEMRVALTHADVSYALVGGLAVSVRTQPRFTRDIDLAISTTDDAAWKASLFRSPTSRDSSC